MASIMASKVPRLLLMASRCLQSFSQAWWIFRQFFFDTLGMSTYIWVIFRANVGKYSIHGAYGQIKLARSWAKKKNTEMFFFFFNNRTDVKTTESPKGLAQISCYELQRVEVPPGIIYIYIVLYSIMMYCVVVPKLAAKDVPAHSENFFHHWPSQHWFERKGNHKRTVTLEGPKWMVWFMWSWKLLIILIGHVVVLSCFLPFWLWQQSTVWLSSIDFLLSARCPFLGWLKTM